MSVSVLRRLPAGPALRRHWGIVALTLAALAFYLTHAIWQQVNYRTTGYDLGIFDQALRRYAHFQAPLVPLKGEGVNILGDHFHPIITSLVPLYWIFESPVVLLVAQAVLTAAAVPVVYRFALRRCSPAWAALFAAVFAFGWGVQTLIDFDFHEVAFATPLLALAVDALDRRADRQLVLWCALLLLVREDMGIVVAVLALLLLAQRRGWRRPALLFAAGAAAYLVVTKAIIPHFATSTGFSYDSQFGELGDSVADAAKNIVIRPWKAVEVFFSPVVKTRTLLLLLTPFALLPLRSRYCWLALPLLAERMFNTRHNLWEPSFHYNALPWLIFTLAAVDGAHRLGLFDRERLASWVRYMTATILIGYPVVLAILGNSVTGVVSVREMRTTPYGTSATWLTQAKQMQAWLPDDVCVIVENRLVPHLTGRDWVTTTGVPSPPPDFYVIDLTATGLGGNPPVPTPGEVEQQALDQGYRIVQSAWPFVVLQSPDYTGPSKACAPLGPGKAPN